jgi:putative MATE family efflux protein
VNEENSLLTGAVRPALLRYALPIILSMVATQFYAVADTMIIGLRLDADALAAVSNASTVLMIFLFISGGMELGGGLLVAAGKPTATKHEMTELLYNLLFVDEIIALLTTAVGFVTLPALLRLINTPAEILDTAVLYGRIYLLGLPFLMPYDLSKECVMGCGDSKTPLKVIVATSVMNIVLDLVLVGPFGVAGAAAATVFSQLTSAALICRHVCRLGYYRFGRDGFSLEQEPLGALMRLCAPQVVQMVLTNSSFMLIGGLINYFGVNASAAAGAVTKIWNFTVLAGQAMMAAMITMTAQNYPRKAYERILKALGAGCMLVTAVAAVITLLCELSPEWMLSLFTDEQAVVESGIRYLRFFAIGFIVENIMFCMFGTLTGAGHTMVPFCCAVISAYLVRYLLAWVFSRMTALGFDGIAIAYSIAPFISCAICSVFIASGRWKKPRIKVS